jgi:hypothetical protein
LLCRACPIYTHGYTAATPTLKRKGWATAVDQDISADGCKKMMASVNAHSVGTAGTYYTLNKCKADAVKAKAIAEEVMGGTVPWPDVNSITVEASDARLAELLREYTRKTKPRDAVNNGDKDECNSAEHDTQPARVRRPTRGARSSAQVCNVTASSPVAQHTRNSGVPAAAPVANVALSTLPGCDDAQPHIKSAAADTQSVCNAAPSAITDDSDTCTKPNSDGACATAMLDDTTLEQIRNASSSCDVPGGIIASDNQRRRSRLFTPEEKSYIVDEHDKITTFSMAVAAKGARVWDYILTDLQSKFAFEHTPHCDSLRNVVRAHRLVKCQKT